jgi:hypothetical protein
MDTIVNPHDKFFKEVFTRWVRNSILISCLRSLSRMAPRDMCISSWSTRAIRSLWPPFSCDPVYPRFSVCALGCVRLYGWGHQGGHHLADRAVDLQVHFQASITRADPRNPWPIQGACDKANRHGISWNRITIHSQCCAYGQYQLWGSQSCRRRGLTTKRRWDHANNRRYVNRTIVKTIHDIHDPSILKILHRKAIKVESIEEFEHLLEAMMK